jgi:hypothetical protein
MTFKYDSFRKGLHIVTSTTAAKTSFPSDGSQPLSMASAIRVQNTDGTVANGVYVLTGKAADNANAGPSVDTSCHYIPGGSYLDLHLRDTDDCIAIKAAAGTPAVNVHFGHAGLAD